MSFLNLGWIAASAVIILLSSWSLFLCLVLSVLELSKWPNISMFTQMAASDRETLSQALSAPSPHSTKTLSVMCLKNWNLNWSHCLKTGQWGSHGVALMLYPCCCAWMACVFNQVLVTCPQCLGSRVHTHLSVWPGAFLQFSKSSVWFSVSCELSWRKLLTSPFLHLQQEVSFPHECWNFIIHLKNSSLITL